MVETAMTEKNDATRIRDERWDKHFEKTSTGIEGQE